MVVIGITGQTGAGKSTALRALTPLGGHTIDCDLVYHHLLDSNIPLQEDLQHRFGDLRDADGSILRKKLGEIVFHDRDALNDLNTITHRHIMAAVSAEIAQAEERGCPAVAIDAIRLIESGLSTLCHSVVAITASEHCRILRIMAREGISQEYATARVTAQAAESFYIQHANYVLSSDTTTPAQLEEGATKLFIQILSEQEGVSQ